MHVIGEDRSERLDVIPAQYRVLVSRGPIVREYGEQFRAPRRPRRPRSSKPPPLL